MKVYVLERGDYEARMIVGVFDSLEAAKGYTAVDEPCGDGAHRFERDRWGIWTCACRFDPWEIYSMRLKTADDVRGVGER